MEFGRALALGIKVLGIVSIALVFKVRVLTGITRDVTTARREKRTED